MIWIFAISLAILGIVSWLATKYNWFRSAENLQPPAEPEVCCGMHEVCETDSLQIIDTKPVYFDDEELDVFKGRDSESYTDAEMLQFEYVFETLAPQEVAGWLRSLQLRELKLPAALYEAALMIVGERRSSAQ